MALKHISGFLSYSSLNDRTNAVTKFREQLENELANVCGYEVDVFQDHEVLKTGQDWEAKIFQKIEESDFLICMVTQGFIISDMCAREFNHAKAHGKRIFPIYWYKSRFFEDRRHIKGFEPALRKQYSTLIADIKRLQYKDFRRLRMMSSTASRYINEVSDLAETIDTELSELAYG